MRWLKLSLLIIMATVVTKIVDPGGTGDYLSLADAIAGEARDLVAADEICRIECISTNGAAEANSVSISGFTTDANHYVQIGSYGANRHQGVWDASKYRLSGASANAITIQNDFVYLEGLQISDWGHASIYSTYSGVAIAGNYTVKIEACIIQGRYVSSGYGRGHGIYSPSIYYPNTYAINNIIYDITSNETGRNYGIYNVQNVKNNTLVNCKRGISLSAGMICKNNLVQNSADVDFYGSGGSGCDYNLSSDGTAPGAHSIVNANVLFQDAANKNYLLDSGDTSGAIDGGTDLSGDANFPVTDDILGTARPSGTAFDIGAHEVIQGGGSTQINVSENGQFAEGINGQIRFSLADPLTSGDQIGSLGAVMNLQDAGQSAETLIGQNQFTANDQLTGADGLTAVNVLFGVPDAASGQEAFAGQNVFGLSDQLAGLEDAAIIAQLLLGDNGALSEQAAAILGSIAVRENGGLSSAINLLNHFALLDQALGAEALTVLQQIFKTVADHAAGDGTLFIRAVVQAQETGSLSDGQNPAIFAALSAFETGSLSDALNLIKEAFKILADQATGAEQLTLSAQLSQADYAQASSEAQILSQLLQSDSGLFSDVLSLIKESLRVIVDNAIGQDDLLISVNDLLVSDQAAASDAILSGILVQLKDQAVSGEQITLRSLIRAIDQGALTDQAFLAEKLLQILENLSGSDAVRLYKNIVIESVRRVFVYELQKQFAAHAAPRVFEKYADRQFKKTVIKQFTKEINKKFEA